MRYAQEHKAETREKILGAAARLFTEFGYDGVGVDAIMAEVGLTAGGFYSHFSSKQSLFAESLATAIDAGKSLRMQKDSHPDSLRTMINSYLSRSHRDQVAEGCPLPALTSDVARSNAETRESYEQQLLIFLRELEAVLAGATTSRRETALALMAQCVGGLMLARAVNDEQLSDRILKACRRAALKLGEE